MVAAYSVSGMPSLQACTSPQHHGLCTGNTPSQDVHETPWHTLLPQYRSAEVICADCAEALQVESTLHLAALQMMYCR